MAACFVCNAQDTRLIEIPQFPHFKKNEKYEIAKQIARHLKRLVKQTGNGQPTAIKVPSAMELSTFYHCTPLDVLADNLELAQAGPGDLIAVYQSGAYGLTASPGRFLGHRPAEEILL